MSQQKGVLYVCLPNCLHCLQNFEVLGHSWGGGKVVVSTRETAEDWWEGKGG